MVLALIPPRDVPDYGIAWSDWDLFRVVATSQVTVVRREAEAVSATGILCTRISVYPFWSRFRGICVPAALLASWQAHRGAQLSTWQALTCFPGIVT